MEKALVETGELGGGDYGAFFLQIRTQDVGLEIKQKIYPYQIYRAEMAGRRSRDIRTQQARGEARVAEELKQ